MILKESESESESESAQSCLTFATLWTVAYQDLLSMEFSRQEYRSGLPLPSLGIFPTQGWNPGLPHCAQSPHIILFIFSNKPALRLVDLIFFVFFPPPRFCSDLRPCPSADSGFVCPFSGSSVRSGCTFRRPRRACGYRPPSWSCPCDVPQVWGLGRSLVSRSL